MGYRFKHDTSITLGKALITNQLAEHPLEMIPPLKFLPKPTQQQPDNGSRYPRRFLVENTMSPGSPPFVFFFDVLLHDDLEDSPSPKKPWKTSAQKIRSNLANNVSSVPSHHSLFISFGINFLQVRMKILVSSPGCSNFFSHATAVYIKRVDETQPSKGLEIPTRKQYIEHMCSVDISIDYMIDMA